MIPLLVLNRRFGTGGAERQLVTLLQHMDKQRFAVTAATLYEGGDLASEVRAIPALEWKPLAKLGRWDLLPFFVRYWRLLGTTRPQVIYAFLAVSNVLALLGRAHGAKVVWGMRASDMDASQYDWLERAVFLIERSLARFADLIIANSEAGARYIASRGFPRDRIEVVPNGIDVARFRPDPEARQRIRAEWDIADDDVLVGLVARLDPMKDHETFLAAAMRLAHQRNDVRFVCVGDGPPEYAQQLMGRSRELGLADQLRWTGARSDMAAIYSALDVLCLSSAFGEGFPNVIGEAMACGVPCVATDVGDAHAVIAETGIVVPPRDPEALATAVSVTLEELQRDREEVGAQTRRRIVREYSVERMVSRTEELLAALAEDPLLPGS